MFGIYIHIPFCRKACHYCNFYFSTNLSNKENLINALQKEISRNSTHWKGSVDTIYFGGGTPSLLTENEILSIISCIKNNFNVMEKAEITFEVNPDDCSPQKFKELQNAGINRLSVGIQTFNDNSLNFLNRNHSSIQAINSVNWAKNEGFDNISIDLIYGIPFQDHSIWQKDLQIALSLNVNHISSYCLTIEENTVFGKWAKNGKLQPSTDNYSAEQFELLVSELTKVGFIHYEISNFCKEGFISKHNSSYWHGKHYLGLGPGAHSYNGFSRIFNIENNLKYIYCLENNQTHYTEELLQPVDFVNEYLLTSIRTIWGLDIEKFLSFPSVDSFHVKKVINSIEENQLAENINGKLILTLKGKLLADEVTTLLFTSK